MADEPESTEPAWLDLDDAKSITEIDSISQHDLDRAHNFTLLYTGLSPEQYDSIVHPINLDRTSLSGVKLVGAIRIGTAWQAAGYALSKAEPLYRELEIAQMNNAPEGAKAVEVKIHPEAKLFLDRAKLLRRADRRLSTIPTFEEGPRFVPSNQFQALFDEKPVGAGLRKDWRGRLFGARVQ